MPSIPHSLPTEDSAEGYVARQLGALIGPGVQAPDGSVAADDYLGLASALSALSEQQRAALREAFPAEALELLLEWEATLGLPARPSASAAQRRSYLTARTRAGIAGTPQAILTAAQTEAPEAQLFEQTAVDVASTDPRAVFRFAVLVNAAHASGSSKERLLATLEQQKPAHTQGKVTAQIGFYCDDGPDSVCDSTLLRV